MSKTYPELSKSGFDSNLHACNVIFTWWQGSADLIRTTLSNQGLESGLRIRPGSENMATIENLSNLADNSGDSDVGDLKLVTEFLSW